MRRRLFAILLISVFVLAGCGAQDKEAGVIESVPQSTDSVSAMIEIPDLAGVDSDSAKESILKKSLLPVIEYEYSSTLVKGTVIRTNPLNGVKVEEDSKVTIYVSKGPAGYTAVDGTVEWVSLGGAVRDEWSFVNPQILEDSLYISCELTPGVTFEFKNSGFGVGSLTDTFDKTVPIKLLKSDLTSFENNKKVKSGETADFFIVIPLSQLDSEFPTHIACRLVVLVNSVETNIEVKFSMQWDKSNLGAIDGSEDLLRVSYSYYSEYSSTVYPTTTPSLTVGPASPIVVNNTDKEEWAKVYLEKLLEYYNEGGDEIEKCGFPDVNNDGTPEMILFFENKTILLTEKNGHVDEIRGYYGNISWIEGQNVIGVYWGSRGDYYDEIYMINDGGYFYQLFCGEENQNSVPFRYYIGYFEEDKAEVTEDEYNKELEKYFDYSKAKEFSGLEYTYYECERYLKSLLPTSVIDELYEDRESREGFYEDGGDGYWEEEGDYYEGDPIDEDMIIPSSSSRYLTYADVAYLSKKELRLARNEIYARHGRIFDSEDLKNYFNNCFWYEPEYYSWEFDDNWLSDIEKANINFLKEVEDSR